MIKFSIIRFFIFFVYTLLEIKIKRKLIYLKRNEIILRLKINITFRNIMKIKMEKKKIYD